MFICSSSIAQDDFSDEKSTVINVTGKVTDENGSPLPGANVTVDESELGAAADEEGAFTLEGVEIGSGITASVIGYDSQTIYLDEEVV